MGRHLVQSRSVLALTLGIPLVMTLFLLLLLFQQQRIAALQNETAVLQGRIGELERQNSFYKKAYELTLDDIRQLSKTYGGQDRYEALAQELRRGELAAVLDTPSPEQTYVINDKNVWHYYSESGIINLSCLVPQKVDTISETVLVTVETSGEGDLAFYADANFITRIGEDAAFTLVLPAGMHELALVSKDGGVRVDRLLLDTVEIPPVSIVADGGLGWDVFDCAGAGPPGALRVLVQKS